MEENKTETSQAADDLPPVKNYPLYFFRIIRKLFVVAFYGIMCVLIAVFVFPIMRLIFGKNFRKRGHHFISCGSDFYIHFLSWMWASEFKISKEDLQTLRNLKGCVVVANHPSLLDSIYLIAFLRNTEFVVKAALKKSWICGIVHALYIPNNLDYETIKERCVQELKQGANLVIFPEGTRSPASVMGKFRKGAARIALAAGANVQPVHIGGNRKYGLGKGEAMWKVNPTERYKYEFKVLPQIDISKYSGLPETIAAKRLKNDMRAAIESGK